MDGIDLGVEAPKWACNVVLNSSARAAWLRFLRFAHLLVGLASLLVLSNSAIPSLETIYFSLEIDYLNITQLGHSRTIIAANGMFPGPTMYVKEGQEVVVNVTNYANPNITIHWHGIHQKLSSWADGPAYVTQCPIQTGKSFVHKFKVTEQRGTYFWHAHHGWLRSTLHGAFIVEPAFLMVQPFPVPNFDIPILLGETYLTDIEVVQATAERAGIYLSPDAFTINGKPGPLYSNSQPEDLQTLTVIEGSTVLLRIINAGLNFELYFSIFSHTLTIVEVDGVYVKPFVSEVVYLGPGQTVAALLVANQTGGQYYMSASPFSYTAPSFLPFPTTPAATILQYAPTFGTEQTLALPAFPAVNDSTFTVKFESQIRTYLLNFPMSVIAEVDRELHIIAGFGLAECGPLDICTNPFLGSNKYVTQLNNISYVEPRTPLLEASYYNLSGVFTPDFPDFPPPGDDPSNASYISTADLTTKVIAVDYDSVVQLTIQIALSFEESHPFHLHGQSFYVIGQGFGLFDSSTVMFNLWDPPLRHTVQVPPGGWVTIRFRAVNPGMWLLHCHFERHVSSGMEVSFWVKDGLGVDQTLPPPPTDLPQC